MKFFVIKSADHAYSASTDAAFFQDGESRGLIDANSALKFSEPIDVCLATAGRKWMDFLSPKYSYSPLLCSERVVEALISANLTGFKALSTRLDPPVKKTIEPPWPYYWLIPTGLPYQWSNKLYSGSQKAHKYKFVFESADQDELRSFERGRADHLYLKRIPVEKSWDGSDFNRFTDQESVGIMGYTLCSRRVLDLAAREKWTNVGFYAFGTVERNKLDHLEGPWPPKSFYSKYEPE
jgi:hypothetical protein